MTSVPSGKQRICPLSGISSSCSVYQITVGVGNPSTFTSKEALPPSTRRALSGFFRKEGATDGSSTKSGLTCSGATLSTLPASLTAWHLTSPESSGIALWIISLCKSSAFASSYLPPAVIGTSFINHVTSGSGLPCTCISNVASLCSSTSRGFSG